MSDKKTPENDVENQTSQEAEDTRVVAEKDGTQIRHTPKDQVFIFQPDFSPTGAAPVKTQTSSHETAVVEPSTPSTEERLKSVDLSRNDIDVQDTYGNYTVLARIDDEFSDKGIDGGKISRLTVTEGELGNETILAHFADGEWVKKPSTFLTKQAVEEAIERDNGEVPQKPEINQDFKKAHDPDIDI
ncbi:MAG: hypothetical protein OIF51_08830 [Cellvibrionaceae bacterium]|nr:hypothetical protein [Cellvibrionaceae bacterium]